LTISFVDPKTIPDTYNILLYGPSGSGKSTAAASAPGPILYLNADGPDALRYPRRKHGNEKIREAAVTSGQVLNEVLIMFRNGGGGFKTVVLDTFSAVYSALLEDKAKGGRPTLPQHGDVQTALGRFVKEMRDQPVHLVILAQEHTDKDESSGVIERVPYMGTKNPALANSVIENMTIVGYCGRVAAQEGTGAKYMATLVDVPGRRGKDRTNALGTARELDLSEWVTAAQSPVPEPEITELEAAA
jgi:hypothetical protein